MARMLVTGCAGFIGSHLSEELLKMGNEVVGIDNLDPFYSPEWKTRNLNALGGFPSFRFLEGSIMDMDFLKSSMDGVGVVLHQAAIANVRESLKDPVKYCRVNVLGTANVLESARLCDVKRVVNASSSSVYGNLDRASLPVNENVKLDPISPYALSKLQAERMCEAYCEFYGLQTVSLRYFNVYGPRQRPDEALSIFIKKALSGEEIEIYGDGKQTRDFTFVGDIVQGNILAMERGNGAYNIGDGKSVSVNDLVGILGKVIGMEIRVKHIEKSKADVMHTWADISLARKELGYEPKTDLEGGIRKQVEWFRSLG